MTTTDGKAQQPNTRQSLEYVGCHLAYQVNGAGPQVLFIQGTGVHGEGWRPQIDALQGQHECLIFDNRGMGLSQPRGAPITVSQMADDALAIMDKLNWKCAHVVGHSLGGLVAQELALKATDRVKSLALLCTFARGRDVTRLSLGMLWTGLRSRIGTRNQRRRAFLELVMAPSELAAANTEQAADYLEPLFGHDIADQPPIVIAQLRAAGQYDATPRLKQLGSVPTLVVSAEFDRIAPPALGRGLAAAIPGSRYVELKNAAHGVPLLQPEVVTALLREHFAR